MEKFHEYVIIKSYNLEPTWQRITSGKWKLS